MVKIGFSNIDAFEKAFKNYSKELKQSVVVSQKEAMLEVNKNIINTAPVDTGTAVNSVTISLNKAKPTKARKRTLKREEESEQRKTVARNEASILDAKNFHTIYISTSVEYWQYLEEGTPRMTGLHTWNNALKTATKSLDKLITKNTKKLR